MTLAATSSLAHQARPPRTLTYLSCLPGQGPPQPRWHVAADHDTRGERQQIRGGDTHEGADPTDPKGAQPERHRDRSHPMTGALRASRDVDGSARASIRPTYLTLDCRAWANVSCVLRVKAEHTNVLSLTHRQHTSSILGEERRGASLGHGRILIRAHARYPDGASHDAIYENRHRAFHEQQGRREQRESRPCLAAVDDRLEDARLLTRDRCRPRLAHCNIHRHWRRSIA
mmetsp:Transcript_16103/g.36087  ORF Transcript_16103/g.36087 Transcript_16103/m.36087 type:complete len:230 (-) Transcript_16103:276-965(-)